MLAVPLFCISAAEGFASMQTNRNVKQRNEIVSNSVSVLNLELSFMLFLFIFFIVNGKFFIEYSLVIDSKYQGRQDFLFHL